MTTQDPDPTSLEEALEKVNEAFEVDPLTARGDDDGLDAEDEKETDGNVPVANLE